VSYSSPQTYYTGQAISPLSPTSTGVASPNYSTTSSTIGSGFFNPSGIAIDAAGNIYIGDYSNNQVKKIPVGSNTPVVLAPTFTFSNPDGVAVDASGALRRA
jgi:DNA-binding beta-propeller fold protein YncE